MPHAISVNPQNPTGTIALEPLRRRFHNARGYKLIARSVLETQLLAGLQARVLHPDVVEYTFARFQEELARSVNQQSSETVTARRKLEELEAEIRNCTRAIASVGLSSFLRTRVAAEVTELETRVGISAKNL